MELSWRAKSERAAEFASHNSTCLKIFHLRPRELLLREQPLARTNSHCSPPTTCLVREQPEETFIWPLAQLECHSFSSSQGWNPSHWGITIIIISTSIWPKLYTVGQLQTIASHCSRPSGWLILHAPLLTCLAARWPVLPRCSRAVPSRLSLESVEEASQPVGFKFITAKRRPSLVPEPHLPRPPPNSSPAGRPIRGGAAAALGFEQKLSFLRSTYREVGGGGETHRLGTRAASLAYLARRRLTSRRQIMRDNNEAKVSTTETLFEKLPLSSRPPRAISIV